MGWANHPPQPGWVGITQSLEGSNRAKKVKDGKIHSFILPLSSWTGWGKHGQLWQRRWPVWWQCWHPGKQTPLCLLVGAPMATREVATHWHPETLSGLPSSVHCGNCSFLRMPYRLIPIWTGVTPSIDAHACTIQSLSLSHWGCLVALLLQPYCKWGWEK